MPKKQIFAGPAKDVYAFDLVEKTLTHLGLFRDKSLKLPVQWNGETLAGGIPLKCAMSVNGELELVEVSAANITAWEGVMWNNCDIWIVGKKQTHVVRGVDFTIDNQGEFTQEKAQSVKLSYKGEDQLATDLVYAMRGAIDPTGLIILLNPELQKDATTTTILDASSFRRTIGSGGYGAASALWSTSKPWLKFDGVDNYLSVANSQFMGPELVGQNDGNNRTFDSTSGDWAGGTDIDVSDQSGFMLIEVGDSPVTTIVTLDTDIQQLTPGESYQISLDVKTTGTWSVNRTYVSVGDTSASCPRMLLGAITGTFVTKIFKFVAKTEMGKITITTDTAPTVGDVLQIDNVSIRRSSHLDLNGGEMIYNSNDQGFEDGSLSANWSDTGAFSHELAGTGTGRAGGSSKALKFTAAEAGDMETQHIQLALAARYLMTVGKKYTLEFYAKAGTAGLSITGGFFEGATVTKAINTTTWTKCVINFTAVSADVIGDLRFHLSGADATGTLIDDISITEAVDFSAVVWMKKTALPAALESIVSRYESGVGSGFLLAMDDANISATIADDTNSLTVEGLTADVRDGVPHCVVMTFNRAGNAVLYIDKTAETPVSITSIGKVERIAGTSDDNLFIGSDLGSSQFYENNIGTVAMYRGKILSQAEVDLIYDTQKAVYGL